MSDRSFEIGPIRPPSEANSLLLQVTQGCTWNKCKFCVVYRGSVFHMLQQEKVKQNIDNMAYFRDLIKEFTLDDGRLDKDGLYSNLEKMTQEELHCFYMVYNWLLHGGKSVFLQDGNSIALKPEKLADILFYLREKFPQIERITSYGRAETLSRWSVEQLKLLRESGLDRIHTGFESGSDRVLKMINKGLTQEQQIDGGRKVKEAGMELSVYFMPGIGGLELSEENASETAKVVNEINPDFVRLRTFVLKHDSEMYSMLLNGEFTECSDIQKLTEIRSLIAGITQPDVNIVSDHIVNLIGALNGRIGEDKDRMLAQADRVLKLPRDEQKLYQLTRRHGIIEDYPQLASLGADRRSHLQRTCDAYTDEEAWEEHLNSILRQYV
jgi:hypothetical protein